ncbi:MAG: hypothetical protein ACI81W_002910, partial [Saprospiraceae bacterium]
KEKEKLRTCPNFVWYVDKIGFFDQSRLFPFGIALAISEGKAEDHITSNAKNPNQF